MCMVTAQAPKEVKGKQLSGKVSGKPQSLISEGHGKFSGNRDFSRCLPCSLPVVPLQIKVVDDYRGMQSEVRTRNRNRKIDIRQVNRQYVSCNSSLNNKYAKTKVLKYYKHRCFACHVKKRLIIVRGDLSQ